MAASLYATPFDTEDPDAGNSMINNVSAYYEVRPFPSSSPGGTRQGTSPSSEP